MPRARSAVRCCIVRSSGPSGGRLQQHRGAHRPRAPTRHRLRPTSRACRTTARSTADQAACSAKFGPTLAKIAQDNFDQAGRAQDRATRINLYATAANAGWDSGTDSGLQVADAAIQAGGGECEKIPANEFTPARDCALLQVGPGFVAHVRTTILLARVEAKPPRSVTAAEKRQFNDASLRYVRNTFDFVESPAASNSMPIPTSTPRCARCSIANAPCSTAPRFKFPRSTGNWAKATPRAASAAIAIVSLTADPSLQGETCVATS